MVVVYRNSALKGLSKSLSTTGVGFYFTYKQNSHMTPGRTGGVAWVLTRYGDPKDPKIAPARSFLVRNAAHALTRCSARMNTNPPTGFRTVIRHVLFHFASHSIFNFPSNAAHLAGVRCPRR